MRLSEAIREGGRAIGQARQIVGDVDDGQGGHCAFGAALLYRFGKADWLVPGGRTWLEEIGLTLPVTACPSCGATDDRGFAWTVAHINNMHRWTFDQIADWVQLQEAIAGIGQEQTAKPELVEVR